MKRFHFSQAAFDLTDCLVLVFEELKVCKLEDMKIVKSDEHEERLMHQGEVNRSVGNSDPEDF